MKTVTNLGHITSQNHKVHKRRVNQLIRYANKDLKNDWLWNGRFVISLTGSPMFTPFEDHSGADYDVIASIVDTKTDKCYQFLMTSRFTIGKLFEVINRAIIDEFKVWEEDPNPYQQAEAAGRHPN